MKQTFNPDRGIKVGFIEEGGSDDAVRIFDATLELVRGMPTVIAISTLTNVASVILAECCTTEREAHDHARRIGKEISRCLNVNYQGEAARNPRSL